MLVDVQLYGLIDWFDYDFVGTPHILGEWESEVMVTALW